MTANQIRALIAIALLAATCVTALAAPEPGVGAYHVAYDNAPDVGFGDYLGLPNPNYQRLTLMLSHTFVDTPWSNHFHRIGSYGYTGPVGSPTPALSANDRLPEPYQGDDGLSLLPGAGAFAGKLVSGLGPAALPADPIEQEYGLLTIEPIDALLPYDGLDHPDTMLEDPNPLVDGARHPVHYLLNASEGAYKNPVDGVRLGLQLTGVSPGLEITDTSGAAIWGAVGDIVTLGETGGWSFTPVFAVDRLTAPGTAFSASFKLVDLSDTPLYGDSAPFSFDFVAVPEPNALFLGALVTAIAAIRRR